MPQHKILVFILRDGTKIIKEWSYKSRSEGWNNEARQKAKERSLKKLERRS
ncbi:hypothetical protein [Clostridium botulinum]|uniref:hypothetical protein n=1 Tax=Clostridium botulinum TaxID=1491 RepID=UPI000AA5DC4C|nr:hypothetical protein [Clostridium botulinum]